MRRTLVALTLGLTLALAALPAHAQRTTPPPGNPAGHPLCQAVCGGVPWAGRGFELGSPWGSHYGGPAFYGQGLVPGQPRSGFAPNPSLIRCLRQGIYVPC